ncbi:MAG: FprA family A-type flavoprotein [Firmicutes bacterium]|nr:FprA family A-type flavoprotein [Bacillota bacterium]MDD4335767.1 FprA family A-type flavoprotein [Bacillota bacterium]MDD4792038.1 FprA family A-type flavoprotein [Bacillota bacterium]
MKPRIIREGVNWVGAVDWDRRLFDALVPIPDGTSYNAYLVQGAEKTALLDTVDPSMVDQLADHLSGIPTVDYIVAHHAEQDHSGSISRVLQLYPEARVVCTPKCKDMLVDLLHIDGERITSVEDGDSIDLGGRTLRFIHAPWVHWPETMFTYLEEDKILFTCDFLGSHLATSSLYFEKGLIEEASAKRYFAEIMMPFSNMIVKNLDKISSYDVEIVAPSHGPIHDDPGFIIDRYRQWTSGPMKNEVCIPYVSMHGSTTAMVDALVQELVERGVGVKRFELTASDTGSIAMSLVDAATVVIATPTVLAGAHPAAAYVAFLANALRPRTKFVSVMCSYSWGGKTVDQIAAMISNLRAEVLEPVVCKGYPREDDFKQIAQLARVIEEKHREIGIK